MTTVTVPGSEVMEHQIRGDRLRERRKVLRLSQEALGELAGVDASYISLLERGVKKNPSLSVVTRLAEALNTSIAYLTGKTDDPSPGALREVALHYSDRLYDADAPITERLARRIRELQEELGKLADELAELERREKDK